MEKNYSTKAAVIVLNYNDYITTSKFLNESKKWEMDYVENIVIVDNNSTDNSFEELKKHQNYNIHVIKSDKNGGYAYGNNYGIRYAINQFDPEFIIVSNPDVIIEESTINKNIDVIANSDISMISPKMTEPSGRECDNIAWKLPRWRDDIVLSLTFLRVIFGNPVLYKKIERGIHGVKEVEVLPGSFFIITSQAIQDVDYLDEDTFLYCEERILGYKLKKERLKIAVHMESSYIHNHSVTIDKNIKSKLKRYNILQQSRKYYLTEYLKINRLQIILFELITKIGIIEKFILSKLKIG